MSSKPISFRLTLLDRMIMLSGTITSIVTFVMFLLKIIHYTTIPLTNMFISSSLMSSFNFQPAYLYNFTLYLSFFVQHIVMAMILFKTSIWKFIPKYPLYERYIFNISSSWFYILILELAAPVSMESEIVFQIPFYVQMGLLAIGHIGFIMALFKLGGDIMFPFKLKDIISSSQIQFEGYNNPSKDSLVYTGIYGICRHPMQASALIILCFSSQIYTYDRLVFILAHMIGILIGITMEERRLEKKFTKYHEYKEKVKYKLYPYIF